MHHLFPLQRYTALAVAAEILITEFTNENSEVISPFIPPLNSHELAVALVNDSEELEENMPLVFAFRYTK